MKNAALLVLIHLGLLTAVVSSASIISQTRHGHIWQNETWEGVIHVTGDIIVEEDVTLTIKPGTKVLIAANQDAENLFIDPFDMQQGIQTVDDFSHGVHQGEPFRDEGHHISIRIGGALYAVGTPEQMITITSDSPTPSIYDWNHLEFDHGILSYSIVEFYRCLDPGNGTEVSNNILRHVGECAVCANKRSPRIENNSISYATHELIDMHQSAPIIRNNHLGPNPDHCGIVIDGGSPQILNNVIEGCGTGILIISPSQPILDKIFFFNNDNDILYDYLPESASWGATSSIPGVVVLPI